MALRRVIAAALALALVACERGAVVAAAPVDPDAPDPALGRTSEHEAKRLGPATASGGAAVPPDPALGRTSALEARSPPRKPIAADEPDAALKRTSRGEARQLAPDAPR